MTIPTQLESLLRRDNALHGAVLMTYETFAPWLGSSGTPFFPEYTDHSTSHVLDVLQTASSLVKDESWASMTPGDVAVLCIATLLHDCAMHISEEGFTCLLDASSWIPPLIPGESNWSDLWAEYYSEATRFDGRKLMALFGDTKPVQPPDENPINWTKRDRLLIGEFVRRHHPRMAHEIALGGVPGPHLNRLKLTGVAPDFANLSGLVARSHGIGLRAALSNLGGIDARQYKGVHLTYLMVVLRIADYLQLQSERAPTQLLQIKRLCSPLSTKEWLTHSAILDIRHTHDDPEAIYIETAPPNVQLFKKIKTLLNGLQSELDISWAVLGETYGRIGGLASLGLVIRRVRSSLDNEESFSKSVKYLPVHAKFDSAGTDLLKLLVGPLYEYAYEVGIRELLQNSIDACLERNDFEVKRSIPPFNSLAGNEAISIRLLSTSENSGHLELSDHGIGMTASVIVNYFLKAGASFRRSDMWRRQHERSPGESNVLRSGRFGIGAVAAFLLGDEITVSTRHIGALEHEGISFKASLDTEDIQLEYCSRSIGTTITVNISDPDVWKRLTERKAWESTDYKQWDFYCGSELNVGRYFVTPKSASRRLKQEWGLPRNKAELHPPRHRINVEGYDDIQWTYNRSTPALACNSILVNRYQYENRQLKPSSIGHGLELEFPNISVFDRNGLLPINLQRNRLVTKELPFHRQLIASQCEDLIAWTLVNAPTSLTHDLSEEKFPALTLAPPRTQFGFVSTGSVLVDSWTIRGIRPKRMVFVPSDSSVSIPIEKDEMRFCLNFAGAGTDIRRAWFRCAMGWNLRDKTMPFQELTHIGSRIILSKTFYDSLRAPGIVAQFLWDQITVESFLDRWKILTIGRYSAGKINFKNLAEQPLTANLDGLTEYFPGDIRMNTGEHGDPKRELFALEETWERLLAARG